jgi:hypothetical protein
MLPDRLVSHLGHGGAQLCELAMVRYIRRDKQPDARSATSAGRAATTSGQIGGADQTGLGTQLRDPQLGHRPVPMASQAGTEGSQRGSAQQLDPSPEYACAQQTGDDLL